MQLKPAQVTFRWKSCGENAQQVHSYQPRLAEDMQTKAPGHPNSKRVLSKLRNRCGLIDFAGHRTLVSEPEDPEPRAKRQDTAMATAITRPSEDFKTSALGPHTYVLYPHVTVREADIGRGNAQGHSTNKQLSYSL